MDTLLSPHLIGKFKDDLVLSGYLVFYVKGDYFMDFEDKTLVCKDCGKEFIFSAGEQEFYAEKGFENEPARCRDCRDKRRRSRDGGEQRQMYTVVCAECGKETEVPFEPKNDRPVYCRDCFNKKKTEF